MLGSGDGRRGRRGEGRGRESGSQAQLAGDRPIVAANANPVFGVWFLGWQPLRPIFFYWLDGLLAIWGLGVVAAVVTSREKPKNFGASGVKLWLIWVAVIGLIEGDSRPAVGVCRTLCIKVAAP